MSFTFGNIAAVLGGLILVAAGAVLLRAATLPDQMRLVRSIIVPASADRVYPMIANVKAFNAWNPFAKSDPTSQIVYSETLEGVGAGYVWSSPTGRNAGRLKLIEAKPSASVTMQLNFEKPFVAENYAVFTLQPKGDQTEVTWTMTGANPLLARIFGVVFRFEKFLGNQFERGLADLKVHAG